MATETAPVILYYNGELKNEGNIVEYLRGGTKLFQASKLINFTDFCVKIEEACVIQLGNMYRIMTRLRLDEHSVAAVDVSDDASLETAMNMHPNSCSVVVFYIVRTASSGYHTNPPITLAMPRVINSQADASSISNGGGVNGRFEIQVETHTQKRPRLTREPSDNPTDGMTKDDPNVQLEDTFMDGMAARFDNVNTPCRDPLNNDDENVESNSGHDWDFTKEFTTSKLFNGREELLAWARKAAMSLGFVVTIKKSSQSRKGKNPRTQLHCDRSGSFRDRTGKNRYLYKTDRNKDESGIRKRRSRSKLTGCPFELRAAKKGRKGDLWEIKVHCGHHNHPPAKRLEGHPYAERLTEEEKMIVTDMIKIDARPKEILETLKELRPENCSKISTIYNAKRKIDSMIKAQMQQALDNFDLQVNASEEDCEHIENVMCVNRGVVDS
ncbi:hypothetical protein GIB67_018600 [Kingdonia uniflora]|uniref:FAR1 domain-containing protein n=1 Tax=Kingdonia uniflora TaxID=39325 RepID=A0A7J7L8H7_9MAGN|nr:hypothetical protein GIB67_018600 [Kingdonia uniflora]